MNIVLDTCALIHLLKNSEKTEDIISIINNQNNPFLLISIVTKAELLSLTLKNNWGEKKQKYLEKLLKKFLIVPIESNDLVQRYAEIDAFSQGKLINKPLLSGMTSRNMGKNDIWIASTASLSKSKLITFDNDFDHLDNVFINLEKIE
jgi:predicted nucleic acid-binding protein